MIDLSPMKAAGSIPARALDAAGPALTWGELDTATQRLGWPPRAASSRRPASPVSRWAAASAGSCASTAWPATTSSPSTSSPPTATRLRASADEHPELFWGLRGGGGNFGVVTSFEFRLHPLGTVLAGLFLHPLSRAREVLERYRDSRRPARPTSWPPAS